MDIRSLGGGLLFVGVVLAVGAFVVGWSLPHPAVSAVSGFVAVGVGAPVAGLAMVRTADPRRRYVRVYLSTVVSLAALSAQLYLVYLADLDWATALGTLVYLGLIVVPAIGASGVALWIAHSHRRPAGGNERTSSGV